MFTYVADSTNRGTYVHEFNSEARPSDRSEATIVEFATMWPNAIYFFSEEVLPCPDFSREHLICCSPEHKQTFHGK